MLFSAPSPKSSARRDHRRRLARAPTAAREARALPNLDHYRNLFGLQVRAFARRPCFFQTLVELLEVCLGTQPILDRVCMGREWIVLGHFLPDRFNG